MHIDGLSLGVKSSEEGKCPVSATFGLVEQSTQGIKATSEEAFGRVAVFEAA